MTDDHAPDPLADGDDDAHASDAGGGSSSIATGVLASAKAAQTAIDRRRRWLVGGAVLGLSVVAAVLVVRTTVQAAANREATETAARQDAAASFAAEVVDRAEAYELPAMSVAGDAEDLVRALEEQLVTSRRSDPAIDGALDGAVDRLLRSAETLEELTARPVPEVPEEVPGDQALLVLQALETLRVEAGALVDEIRAATDEAERWRDAVDHVNEALDEHIAVVAAEQDTTDPGELIDRWNAEGPTLRRLAAVARTEATVEGLGDWAGAHATYAEDQLAWTREAVELLESLQVEAYNQRYLEVFDVPDPFGFRAAATAAVASALRSPAIQQAENLATRAAIVTEAVVTLEQTVAEALQDV